MQYTNLKCTILSFDTGMHLWNPNPQQDIEDYHHPESPLLFLLINLCPHFSMRNNSLNFNSTTDKSFTSQSSINSKAYSMFSASGFFSLSIMFIWDLFILLSASGVCFLLELRSIPFYKYTTICLFILLLMDTWAASSLWLLWIKAAINILCWVFLWTHVFILVEWIPKSRVSGSKSRRMPSCIRNLYSPLSEKAMATHSSTLAWKIPWTEEPGRLQSMGSLRVGHNWVTSLSLFTFMHWRRKWQLTPVFLPGESQGWRSLVSCCLWGRTESDTTEVT